MTPYDTRLMILVWAALLSVNVLIYLAALILR